MTLPDTMSGVVLTGYGGLDRLEWRTDLPVPRPGSGEVLIRVLAAGVNNTDINTRTGWYSRTVTGASGNDAVTTAGDDGTWTGRSLDFPHVQGADCCGVIVACGADVPDRTGARVLVRTMQNWGDEVITLGSERPGAFAEYMVARSHDALTVACDWTDVELASIPCATTTAEGMLHRVGLGPEKVLITGASGGVGSAAVQLARRRGAEVWAVTQPQKADELRALGAQHIVERDAPLPPEHFDVVVDLVAGPRWGELIDALRPGGRYVASGAIAGPIVELDVRTLYLKDLTLMGATQQPDHILPDAIGYIERGEIRPHVAATFPLREIRAAQEAFLSKAHVGKIVLTVASG